MGAAAQARTQSVVPESDYPEQPQRKRSQSREKPKHRLANLERACRIALLETDQPTSVEGIYDRITKRGSFVFVSYERAFRAIALAMARLVRRGEAILLFQRGETRAFKRSNLVRLVRSDRV